MATPLQQASVRRKLIYTALIVVLFTANAFGWRGVSFFERDANGQVTVSRPASYTLTAKARDLELSEADEGDADPTGASIRLILTGSRGLAVTLLWQAAIKKQEKHEWNELELLVRSVTKLEPHFITIWLFQSWNLAYNVSVESDRPQDKYFFISRGIELGAEGERVNRNNPDLRWWTGFYYQNKFGVSDEAITLRSLMQMSCIDPRERDPDTLWQVGDDGRPRPGVVDPVKFRAFCEKHPQLVRRLHERLRKKDPFTGRDAGPQISTPAQIVDFLAEHRKLPSRYYDPKQDQTFSFIQARTGLKTGADAIHQFPVLPPRTDQTSDEAAPEDELDDSFDNYLAARAWFSYSLLPLPPATRSQDPAVIYSIDLTKYRIPRAPIMIIFRQKPARAQTYVAERLQEEGWFDEDGWEVDRYQTREGRWFPTRIGEKPVRLGANRRWGEEAWGESHARWKRHGEANGLWMSDTDRARLEATAAIYNKHFSTADRGIRPTKDQEQSIPGIMDGYLAYRHIMHLMQNLTVTNYSHWLFSTEAQMDERAIAANKLLFDADHQRKGNELNPEVVDKYRRGFALFKQVFLAHPVFRNDEAVQEDLYERMIPYIRLLQEQAQEHDLPVQPRTVKNAQIVADCTSQVAAWSAGAGQPSAVALGLLHALMPGGRDLPNEVPPPFDGVDAKGKPWISTQAVIAVRQRKGLTRSIAPPPNTPGMPPPPPPKLRPGVGMTPG